MLSHFYVCIYVQFCLCVKYYLGQCIHLGRVFLYSTMTIKACLPQMINVLATNRPPLVGYIQFSIH